MCFRRGTESWWGLDERRPKRYPCSTHILLSLTWVWPFIHINDVNGKLLRSERCRRRRWKREAVWKRRHRGAEGVEGMEFGRGYPLPSRLWGLRERRKLPHRSKTILEIFKAWQKGFPVIVCRFFYGATLTRSVLPLTQLKPLMALWKRVRSTSYTSYYTKPERRSGSKNSNRNAILVRSSPFASPVNDLQTIEINCASNSFTNAYNVKDRDSVADVTQQHNTTRTSTCMSDGLLIFTPLW